MAEMGLLTCHSLLGATSPFGVSNGSLFPAWSNRLVKKYWTVLPAGARGVLSGFWRLATKSAAGRALPGTMALCSWLFCIAWAVFWKCQSLDKSSDASTVNQVAWVLS